MPNGHVAECDAPDCPGCYTLDPDAPAPQELIDAVKDAQGSNSRRLAQITAALPKPPNLTIGLVDLLADEVLGAGTVRRFLFTLQWEEKVAAYCDVQEAEIRKAHAANKRGNGKHAKMLRGL